MQPTRLLDSWCIRAIAAVVVVVAVCVSPPFGRPLFCSFPRPWIWRASSISLRLEETHWNRCCRERTDRFECVYTLEGLGGVEGGMENPPTVDYDRKYERQFSLVSPKFWFPLRRPPRPYSSLSPGSTPPAALFCVCVCVCVSLTGVLDSSVCISVLELGDSVFLGIESLSLAFT